MRLFHIHTRERRDSKCPGLFMRSYSVWWRGGQRSSLTCCSWMCLCAPKTVECLPHPSVHWVKLKAWMALNFLDFNEKKTEVIVSWCHQWIFSCRLGPLGQFEKSTITNLGFRVDQDFRLNSQISAVLKSRFFQLRPLAKLKNILSKAHFRTVIHTFITSWLHYCNSLYAGVRQSAPSRLQLLKNAAARLLTGTQKRERITPVLSSLHWSACSIQSSF